ncbi:MAG: sugar transferase [Deltaproteobacteria bacterium]|nr:sugar transferase [Deltaproteobacteria bacterium]
MSRTLDFLSLVAAFAATSSLVSYLGRSDLFIWPAPTSSDIAGWPAQYIVLLLSALIAWNLVNGYLGEYQREQPNAPDHVGRLARAGLLWMAATAFAIFVFKLREISRVFLLSYMVLGGVSIALRDWAETVVRRGIHRSRGAHRSAIVVGNGTQARWLRQFLLDNYCPEPYALVRQVDPADSDFINGQAGSASKSQAAGFDRAAEVFVAAADIGADASALFPRLFEHATEAHIVPGVFDASIFKLALRSVGGVPLITLRSGALTGLEGTLKRTFDIAVAALLLTLVAPLMTIIALLIKVSSPGPVFFRQERVGKGGRRIQIYKFRTMHQNAEGILKANSELYRSYVENNYKLPKGKDPRVTFIGGFLRELSLDEIPQLFNVLKGEMSMVGPRPVVPAEIEKYGDYASLLLSVQPGLTGQWQVSGRSDIADYARRVRIDMEYIRDQSIARDLRILFRTVPAVLSREGAH